MCPAITHNLTWTSPNKQTKGRPFRFQRLRFYLKLPGSRERGNCFLREPAKFWWLQEPFSVNIDALWCGPVAPARPSRPSDGAIGRQQSALEITSKIQKNVQNTAVSHVLRSIGRTVSTKANFCPIGLKLGCLAGFGEFFASPPSATVCTHKFA